ncbi:hypothetical protein NDU88_002902 [Pleurodeles waltl]|uniref:Uncharacterized protein n=1 Tax=Pleurodeles waltl TaxID=8319 RepID=A0AAV7SBW1_PLEWA|nr:hypothetical protein NDU88_002902 [Pleurodeles waltl]
MSTEPEFVVVKLTDPLPSGLSPQPDLAKKPPGSQPALLQTFLEPLTPSAPSPAFQNLLVPLNPEFLEPDSEPTVLFNAMLSTIVRVTVPSGVSTAPTVLYGLLMFIGLNSLPFSAGPSASAEGPASFTKAQRYTVPQLAMACPPPPKNSLFALPSTPAVAY